MTVYPSDHAADIRVAADQLTGVDLATAGDSREVCRDLAHACASLADVVRGLIDSPHQTLADLDEDARAAADALGAAASGIQMLADSH